MAKLGKSAVLGVVGILCTMAGLGASAADWPQFHGPKRDNLSAETGLLAEWPDGGPKLLWTAQGLGEGFASVAIAAGLIYTTGNVGPDTLITALDLDGKSVWTVKNGPADKHDRSGTRSTPTIDGGRLYHENSYANVVCLEAKTGKAVWSVDLLRRFGGRSPQWGHAESPLIDGNRAVCAAGGPNAGMVALDKTNGETLWVCQDTTEKPGYASPIAIEFGGVRQYVTMMEKSVVGVRADDGKLLWRVPHVAFADETASTPSFRDRYIVVSTLPPGGTQCIELSGEGDGITAKKAWQTNALPNHHGGVLVADGYVYGSAGAKWMCLGLKTGQVMYGANGVGKGSLTYADGMLYTYSEDGGSVGLVKATPDGHALISQFRIPAGGRGPCWAHPVVCGGRLYLRHGDFLYGYDIQAK